MTQARACQVVFELVQNDDVDALISQLEQQPFLINIADETAQTLLIRAAERGSVKVLKELLKRNTLDPNETDQDETTALIAAAKENNQECVTELINNGADLTITDKDDWGAITWAAYRGHVDVVKILLAVEANPNETGQHGMNPVIWAAGRGHTNVVEELLNAGGNPDSCDKYGTSALVWASRKGHGDIIKVLLDKGANVDKPGTSGWTPLIMAAKGGFEQAAGVLLNNGADVNFLDQDKYSALIWAVKQGHTNIVRTLADHGSFINIRNKEGIPVLTLAAKEGHVEIVRILLEHYADVEAMDLVGKTALWYAVEKGHADIVKELLEFGAFTECKRKDGETPLLLAVRKKHTAITSLLLDKNADLSVSNKQGDTALHIAVRCRYRRIAEIILKDPKSARLLYQTNRAGETPYRIDHRHKKSILKPVLGMAEGDWRHTEELLGHDVYTTSLAELLCEPSLEVPLTVGVYARWGSSKVHFFKSLQEEMKEITQQTVRPKLRFTVFGVLTCLFFCTLLGVCFCSAFNWIVGIAVGGTVLVLSHVIYLVILLWENKWCDNTESSWISEYFCRFSSYFYLLYLITFCVPPTLTSMRSSLPVHFAFADFSKLTRSSNEATALVSMIETLTEVFESNFGCVASRLFRVLRPPLLDYVGIKHSQPQFKKCCCCIPKLCIFFFVVTCGAVALVLYTTDGSDGSSVVAGLQISGACIVGIALVVHSTTFCSVIYSLLFSPKRRVSIVATQLGLKEEGFIHALKQEVELLTEVAVAMDGFKNIQTRIILFLDGLDHSEQQKVLHLVDSINLLFTDPDAPFISIIAIDPRVTVRAIEQNFSNVLQDSHITALDYLKSIIHLPFFLPEPKTSCSGNLPDSLRLSVEQLLRQRKTSGFELEWEGESFELTPGSVDKWKANGAVANNKHTTVLTVDQSQTVEGKFSARLNRSYMDIHFDQHEDSPDLTHVLADNETLTPLGIQRLLHTTSLSGRLLRAKGFDFRWNGLASWVSLVDAWPYRVSWLVHIMEEFTNILPDNLPLKALYMSTQTWLPNSNGLDYAVDNDPAYFESFLGNHCPILKMEDLRKFLVGTINLDPAIRNQISQGLQACSSKTLSKTESAGIGAGGVGQSDSLDLGSLSEEDVCVKLSQIDGIQLTSMPSYQMTIRENHINGRVLCECEISELRDVMEMNFGDWQLFRAWILRHRPSEVCQEGDCSAWVDDQVERAKADSADTYVEMGNLSCVKSNASTSQDRTGGENRSPQSGTNRGPTNKRTIPRIVLDPGSSLNSISNCDQVQTAGDDENVSDAGQDADNIRRDGEKKVQVMMSNDVYSITPRPNITDSSEDEGSATENTPLMNDEVSSASKDREETPKGHSDEIRPLLSRQNEIDEGAGSKQETDVNNTSRNVEAGCMSNSSTCTGLNIIEDDNVESQRVTPILFTLSSTKKGSNQVVSSVVATRDVSLALSRSPSLPGSPSSRRPKSPKSPRCPRSPKSSRSLRGIFSCRSPLPSEDNADEDNDKGQPAVTEDISGFDPRAPNGHCLTQDTLEVKQSDKKITDVETSNAHVDPVESHAGEEDVDDIHAQTPTWLELAPTKDSNVSSNEIPQDPSKDSGRSKFLSETLQPFVESSTDRSVDNPNVNRYSKDNLFEETTTNSDKGYESVDNSPSCVENDGIYPSLNANGSVSTNGLSETTNPVWVPCMESKTFPRRHKPTAISGRGSHFLHQTMV